MSSPLPSASMAISIAAERLGWQQANAHRFSTGSSFYVFEVIAAEGIAVIRIGLPEQRTVLLAGLRWNGTLRSRGVPLPKILADGTAETLPYFIMERLAGTDLGHVIADLTPAQRTAIASAVAEAQLATGTLGPAKRFGFSADGDTAPHATWGDVVAANLDRSRRRLDANAFFPASLADPLLDRLMQWRPILDAFPATPFLHDTTTKNVIIAPDGTLSGIVDVDDLCFGDPRYAPALTRAAIIAFGGPPDYVAPWLARMQLADDDVMQFYVALFLLDFLAEQGMVFNGNPSPSQPAERLRLLGLYHAALQALP